MSSDDGSIAFGNQVAPTSRRKAVATSKGRRKWSRKAERQLGAIGADQKKELKPHSLGRSQTELLTLISDSCTADNAGVPDGHEPDGSTIVVALQQQLDTIIEEHIKLDNPQGPAYRDLLHDVSVACASALGKLSGCDQAVLSAMLTDQFSEECSMVPQGFTNAHVPARLSSAIAVLWQCVLEKRVADAVASVDMLRPSQRLPQEKRAPLICCAQVAVIVGHAAVAAKAICGAWVCSSAENVKVDRHNHPLMRTVMHSLYGLSQAFNKSGRSKLLVPVDVALEGHFADDKVMKVHLPLMRRGFVAEDAWQAFLDGEEASPSDSATAAPSCTATTRDKENKSKASASTRTGQTLRRPRMDSQLAPGAALAAKSRLAKAQGLHRTSTSKNSKHVIRTHHHLVPRMAMPTQVQQKAMSALPMAKKVKRTSRVRNACPLSVIPDTEKVERACVWDAPSESVRKRLEFLAEDDAAMNHGGLPGVTVEDFAMFPAVDLPAVIQQKKTIFAMH